VAKLVVILFYVLIAVELVSIGSSYLQVQLLERAAIDGISDEEANANDVRQMIVGGVQLLLFVALGFSYLAWLRRSYRNQSALGAQGLKYSPNWATAYWFIPIVNLFRPYQVTKEIYQTSDPNAEGTTWSFLPVSALLGWWWAAWIIASAAGRAASRSTRGEPTIEQLVTASWIDIVSSITSVIAAVLALMVVRKITDRQTAKFDSQRMEMATMPNATQALAY